jgi:hypothetical protein
MHLPCREWGAELAALLKEQSAQGVEKSRGAQTRAHVAWRGFTELMGFERRPFRKRKTRMDLERIHQIGETHHFDEGSYAASPSFGPSPK